MNHGCRPTHRPMRKNSLLKHQYSNYACSHTETHTHLPNPIITTLIQSSSILTHLQRAGVAMEAVASTQGVTSRATEGFFLERKRLNQNSYINYLFTLPSMTSEREVRGCFYALGTPCNILYKFYKTWMFISISSAGYCFFIASLPNSSLVSKLFNILWCPSSYFFCLVVFVFEKDVWFLRSLQAVWHLAAVWPTGIHLNIHTHTAALTKKQKNFTSTSIHMGSLQMICLGNFFVFKIKTLGYIL